MNTWQQIWKKIYIVLRKKVAYHFLMDLQKHRLVFNFIAPVYNLFFRYQCREMTAVINTSFHRLGIPQGGKILDIGCGTGALVRTLQSFGYKAEGVDMSEGMLKQASSRGLECQYGNALEGLPYPGSSFDLVTLFFVAHGLDREKRKVLFREAARISRGTVLIHDYSGRRNRLIDFVEYMEGGDYFNFIKTGPEEMADVFGSVETVEIKKTGNWYICRTS